MINASNVYKEAIKKNRILHHRVEIQFQDGSSKTVEDMELLLFQILDNTSGQNSFDLGSAIAKQLNIKLSNIDGKFTGVDFDGATIKAIIGLELPDGTTEWLDRGIYTAEPGEDTGSVIAVKAIPKAFHAAGRKILSSSILCIHTGMRSIEASVIRSCPM